MSLLTKRVKRKPSLTKSRSFQEDYTVNDLPALRRKRTIAYNRLSKTLEIGLKSDGDEEFRELFLSYYQEVKNTVASFEDTHFTILSIHDTDEEDDGIQERFDDIHFRVISIYRKLTNATEKKELSQNNNTLSRIRLPKITLPTFDGQIKHWPEFFDTFNALIHISPTLNNTEKFHYLISSLSGDALAVIRPFPITGDHYHDAYQALTSRYENTRELAFTCWRDILNIEFKVNNAKEFRRSLDAIDENLSILEKLHLPVTHWDFILIYHILSKLDSKMRRDFEEKHSGFELPKYKQLKSYLHSKCEALIRDTHFSESSKPVTSNRETQRVGAVPHFSNSKRNLSHTLVVSHEEPKQRSSESAPSKIVRHCSFCGDDHLISSCKPFAQKSIEERRSIAQEKKWCYNCLKPSHHLKDCTSFFSCQKCKRKHHTLLHEDGKAEVESKEKVSNATKSSLIVSNANTTVLLATALVQVTDATGKFHTFRALFDTGSQNNLITEQAAKVLNIRPSRVNACVHGLGDAATAVTGTIRCSIGTNTTPFFRDVHLDVINKICGDQPIAKLNTSGWSHIKSLPLADPGFDMPGPIDLLLGANLFVESLLNGRIKGDSIRPTAFNSVFGWLLLGKTPLATSSLVHIQSRIDNDLHILVQKMWEIDVVPQATTLSPEESLCEQKYLTEHYRTETGRYVVRLPFKDSVEPTFINSRDIALRRFYALERRLSRDIDLKRQYAEFMSEYHTLGHMNLVSSDEIGRGKYYIPHHCVVRPESTTTKLRVVFDASAKDENSNSLNSKLLIGPKLLSNIADILLRFREHVIVFMADVRQMYRQIVVAPEHRGYQRILWRANPSEPLQEFELTTVTYGTAAAPFLACRTIQQLALDEGDLYPLAKQICFSDIYVDDVVSGCQCLKSALDAKTQLLELFKRGQFELRKWASNEPQFLADIPHENCLLDAVSFEDTEPAALKVLGLKWSPSIDSFLFDVKPSNQLCTKRAILSEVARIFDPLGFLSPLTIQAKCLIQKLWIIGVSWDESPPDEIQQIWAEYQCQLPILRNLRIPRRLTVDNAKSYELHGFCDSSEAAYGAVLYLRVVRQDDSVQTFLICAKARVAPLKRLSIPRLELCAALLLADLYKVVKDTYLSQISLDAIHLWSDSTIVLSWLKSHSSRWVTFVANRVSHIQEIAPTQLWRHVPSGDNPADLCSRGQLPESLIRSTLWWAGPPWLTQSQSEWPIDSSCVESNIVQSEERKKAVVLVANQNIHFIDNLLNRFSSLDKIVGIIAYTSRFLSNLRHSTSHRQTLILTSDERHRALMIIVKHVQGSAFASEIVKLNSGQPLPKPLRKLNPFLDPEGILRVGGRISRSGLEYDHKHPALLPGNNILTTRIIESLHWKHCHPGVNTTLYLIVQQFWIVSAKRIIRRCLSDCIRCFRTRPQTLQPFMSDLPSFRVNHAKPFSIVGVDFGGPFRIKLGSHRGAKTDKAYLCLFVCLTTKAVHLEVVSTLSTEGFIAALRRFVARRGRCSVIHSDCGTNFIGAHNYLASLMEGACHSERLEFKFNPPSAPHFGGVWEIQIKAAKSHLYRTVGDQLLTFEELTTLFTQIEALLNSRPLCPISSDPNDITALTPGHFLTLAPLTTVPDQDLLDVNVNRLNRWQLIQSFHQHFWTRWKNEYLHSLTQRAKWTKTSRPLELNSVVIIKDDNRAPLHWPLGRVVELHPGADGTVRLATLRTAAHTLIKRPLVKLCPLPVKDC